MKARSTRLALLTIVAGTVAVGARPSAGDGPHQATTSFDLREAWQVSSARLLDQVGRGISFHESVSTPGESELLLEPSGDETAPFLGRLAFTIDGDFASVGLPDGTIPISSFAALEQRDVFLGGSEFGFGPGGPSPYTAGSMGGAPILAGLKLSGREGPLRFAAMSLQLDEREAAGRKQLSVGRVALDLANGSSVGLIATAGSPDARADNYLVGSDVHFRSTRLLEDRVVEGSFWVQQSLTDGADQQSTDTALGVRLGYPNDRVRWEVGFTQVGQAFDAALGTVPRRGVREYLGNWRYRIQPGGLVRSIETGVDGVMVTDLEGEVGRQSIALRPLTLEMATSDRVTLQYTFNRELIPDARPVREGVVLAAGEYEYERYEVAFSTAPTRPVRLGLKVAGGDWYSGTRVETGVGAGVRLAPGVELSVEYQQDEVELAEVGFQTELVRGQLDMSLAPGAAISNSLQYDRLTESMRFSSQLRLQLDDGNELNLAFTQSVTGDKPDGLDPTAGAVVAQLRWVSKF